MGFPIGFRASFFYYTTCICKTWITGIDTITSEIPRVIMDVIDIQTGYNVDKFDRMIEEWTFFKCNITLTKTLRYAYSFNYPCQIERARIDIWNQCIHQSICIQKYRLVCPNKNHHFHMPYAHFYICSWVLYHGYHKIKRGNGNA